MDADVASLAEGLQQQGEADDVWSEALEAEAQQQAQQDKQQQQQPYRDAGVAAGLGASSRSQCAYQRRSSVSAMYVCAAVSPPIRSSLCCEAMLAWVLYVVLYRGSFYLQQQAGGPAQSLTEFDVDVICCETKGSLLVNPRIWEGKIGTAPSCSLQSQLIRGAPWVYCLRHKSQYLRLNMASHNNHNLDLQPAQKPLVTDQTILQQLLWGPLKVERWIWTQTILCDTRTDTHIFCDTHIFLTLHIFCDTHLGHILQQLLLLLLGFQEAQHQPCAATC